MLKPGEKKMLEPCPICGGEQYYLAVSTPTWTGADVVLWEQQAVHCQPVSRWDDTPDFRLCVMELRRRLDALEAPHA